MPSPPEEGDYFVTLERFMEQQAKADGEEPTAAAWMQLRNRSKSCSNR